MARYLVTGRAGFIGSHLVEELLRRGESVRVADNFSTGQRENVPAGSKVDLVEGDLSDGRWRGARSRDAISSCIRPPFRRCRGRSGSADLPPRQRGRHPPGVVGRPRRPRQTAHLCRLIVRLRRHRRAAEARGHAASALVALRAAEAGQRAVPVSCSRSFTASRPSPFGTSTCSARARTQGRRIPA